jgi:uncharacterized protein (DUF488 family)
VAVHALFTIGHSTHPIEEFIGLLMAHEIEEIADVRSIPKSRHTPQFNIDVIEKSLRGAGVRYTHIAKLGGRRHTRKDSINTGWRNASFRGYADYMATQQFAEGLEELIRIAGERRTAMMCAEAVPWRCHRSLIADAMTVNGWEVRDIISPAPAMVHELTKFLKVEVGRLTYPMTEDDAPRLFS